MTISFFVKVEKIVGEEENPGYEHFSLVPVMFLKAVSGLLKFKILCQPIS